MEKTSATPCAETEHRGRQNASTMKWCQSTAKHVKMLYSTYFVIWEYIHVSDFRSMPKMC